MKQKTILLFVTLFLFLTGCQPNKIGTDTQYVGSDDNKQPTVNSAYPVNNATNNQSTLEDAHKDSDNSVGIGADTLNSSNTESDNPYPMGNSIVKQHNPYPMNNENTSAAGNANTGQPGISSPNSPYVFKTSEPNTATLHGVLLVMDPMLALPDSKDGLFLVPITGS